MIFKKRCHCCRSINSGCYVLFFRNKKIQINERKTELKVNNNEMMNVRKKWKMKHKEGSRQSQNSGYFPVYLVGFYILSYSFSSYITFYIKRYIFTDFPFFWRRDSLQINCLGADKLWQEHYKLNKTCWPC